MFQESTSQSDNSKKNAANISQKKTGKQDAPIKSDEVWEQSRMKYLIHCIFAAFLYQSCYRTG